jgi:hypothetical protein
MEGSQEDGLSWSSPVEKIKKKYLPESFEKYFGIISVAFFHKKCSVQLLHSEILPSLLPLPLGR